MKLIAYLRLIRFPNLLIMGLTMYLVRYCILLPLIQVPNVKPFVPELDFFLLVLSILLIAGGGYIVNDYFDQSIDESNDPEKIILGRKIAPDKALYVYRILNAIAIGITIYITIHLQIFTFL